MATAKTQKKTTAGKAAAKPAAKKTTATKIAKKTTGMKEGSRYVCGDCGLVVTVDTACGCSETAHIVCCERPMKLKR